MCVHPMNNSYELTKNNSTDWNVSDECDYVNLIEDVDQQDLVVIQINIRGILSKRSMLLDLIDTSVKDRVPDIIIVNETWLTPTSPSLNVPGYKFVHKCRDHKKGGGVGILLSEKLRFCELTNITSDLVENEFIAVEITLKSGKRCIVSSMYRAPNTAPQIFRCCYNSLVYAMKKLKPYALIIGLDHNMDFLKAAKHGDTSDFMHGNLDMGLVPTITNLRVLRNLVPHSSTIL